MGAPNDFDQVIDNDLFKNNLMLKKSRSTSFNAIGPMKSDFKVEDYAVHDNNINNNNNRRLLMENWMENINKLNENNVTDFIFDLTELSTIDEKLSDISKISKIVPFLDYG